MVPGLVSAVPDTLTLWFWPEFIYGHMSEVVPLFKNLALPDVHLFEFVGGQVSHVVSSWTNAAPPDAHLFEFIGGQVSNVVSLFTTTASPERYWELVLPESSVFFCVSCPNSWPFFEWEPKFRDPSSTWCCWVFSALRMFYTRLWPVKVDHTSFVVWQLNFIENIRKLI